ncbi:MAG: murein hydrolase activator EnvC family protein, partial [Candidatus Methylomirabilales bacterium]
MRHVRPDWSLFVGAALLVCLLLSETVPAAQKRGRLSDTQKELQEVQRELTQERRRAQDAGRREGALARDLERVEALLTAKTAELKRLEAQVGAESREVAALTQELARGERRLDRIERLLGERLRAVYKQGRLGTVRVLLTAGTAEEAARRIKYLTAIAIQDRELAARHRMALAELTGQRETVRAGVSTLAERRNDLREARQEIASEQWRRRILLAKVREEKQGHMTAIRELE